MNEQKRLVVKGKFPNYDTLRIGDTDLKTGIACTKLRVEMDANDTPMVYIEAYALEHDIDIYVTADIQINAHYNGKTYRLVEIEPNPELKGTQWTP